MKAFRLTEHRLNALTALARFEYLTTDQFLRLGVSSSLSNLNSRVLKPLRETSPKLIAHYNRGRGYNGVYCLTKHGAEIAAEELKRPLKSIRCPVNGVQYERDFEHRRGTIDFMIELFQHTQEQGLFLDFIKTYYQGTGAQRRGKKFISDTVHFLQDGRKIEPDLIFRYLMDDDTRRLLVFEFHRGVDTGRIVDQLTLHTQAIHEGVFSASLNPGQPNFVLSVCENPKTLDHVLKRLRKNPLFSVMGAGFLFNTLEGLKEDFAKNWIKIDGSPYLFF